jgi:glycosyltransferase involved in cell wall biosynthesis
MRVTLVHHTRLPVQGYGGTERVVVALAAGLVALGHEVRLIAPPNTKVANTQLIPVAEKLLRDGNSDLSPFIPGDSDIVHAFFPMRAVKQPWLWTLEGTTPAGVTRPPNTIYVSADHARRHNSASFVYNGLDPADFTYRDTKGDYDLFLGRLHSSKGWQLAVQGARAAGRTLIVAGGWRPSLSRTLKFAGEVDGKEKSDLLAGARLLWMPAQWDEPFGLTLIEALWSGTPVLGSPRGALPEVLSPEVSELGTTVEELVSRLPAMAAKRPADCRARAERWFSHTVMAAEYIRFYERYLQDGVLPAGRPASG